MERFNKRDLFAGLVIVFLLGVLAGQQLGFRRRGLSTVSQAVAPVAGGQRRPGESFAGIASAVTPAVVNISSTRILRGRTFRDPFYEFFGEGNGIYRTPDRKSQSLGSGVLVDPDGLVVTNNHNIRADGFDQVEVRVSLSDKREFPAKIIGSDPESDIAVLRIKAANLPFVPWGDSKGLRVGDWVLAVGNPYGFNGTVTAGIVSAKGRTELGLSEFEEFIQTDAAINPGNSGGALVDADGRLVGINTAIFTETKGSVGLGFAIPAEVAKANAEQILNRGKVVRGWIGIQTTPLGAREAAQLGLKGVEGVVVTGVYQGQPAAGAGLRPADVVVGLGKQTITTPGGLRSAVAGSQPGSTVTLRIVRNGQSAEVRCQVVERPVRQDGEPIPGI